MGPANTHINTLLQRGETVGDYAVIITKREKNEDAV